MLNRGRALLGRAGWSFTDQALSSLSNFGLSVLMAKSTGVDGYGAFAIAFTIFTFLQGISRALVNNPYLIRYGQVGDEEAAEAARGGSGLALILGTAAAPIVIIVAFFLHGEAVPTVATMAVALPALLVQDVWRSVFIARQRPRSAAANTAVWTALQFAALGVILLAGERNSAVLMAAWGATGAVAAVLAAWWGGGSPSVRGAREFARRGRDLSGYLVAEWLTLLGALQIALLVVGGIGSAADVGFLRASQTLLGPLNILVVATFSFWVPELVRRPHFSNSRLRTIAAVLSGLLAVLTLACGVVLLSLPDHVGRAILGDVWAGTRPTLLPTTLFMVGVALMVGPVTVIRARGVPRASFKVNLLVGALLLVCTPIGFVMDGAAGAAAGFAVANLVPVPLFWWQMEVALRKPATSVSASRD
jgi:O-antigen/teichoic acid export membrane protein